jgi:TfoX/Sxy family transcriptional regulator of competence genes
MSTEIDYISFVCEQIQGVGVIRSKKMFGEYMVYVNDKPILLVCDNTVFVKKLPVLESILEEADTANPYKGAQEHYILDIEDKELSKKVIRLLETVIPIPKPRKKKEPKSDQSK